MGGGVTILVMSSSNPQFGGRKPKLGIQLLSVRNTELRGLSGGPVVNPPCNARDICSIPGPGRCHMPQATKGQEPQLPGPCATTPEACAREPVCHGKRSHWNETPKDGNKDELLHTATRESPCRATRTQDSQIEIKKINT